MVSPNGVNRYSDEALAEFKAIVDTKLQHAQEQLESLNVQILEVTENSGDEHGGDWMDDSNINNEVEMMNNMAIRQRKYIQDLQNALIRINNKTYGICTVSGELIDKKRLIAVPTTTKSLQAKTDQHKKDEEKQITGPTKTPYVKKRDEKAAPKIITKVLKKPGAGSATHPDLNDDDEEGLLGEDLIIEEGDFDFDALAEENADND
jgi:RNA polymerase-binding transcription factor DksA